MKFNEEIIILLGMTIRAGQDFTAGKRLSLQDFTRPALLPFLYFLSEEVPCPHRIVLICFMQASIALLGIW